MNEVDILFSLLGGVCVAILALALSKSIGRDVHLHSVDVDFAIIIVIIIGFSIYTVRRPDWIFWP